VNEKTGAAKIVKKSSQKQSNERLLSIKGMDNLLRSMGLFVPIREIQTMFKERKLLLLPPDARYKFSHSDIRGFSYDDFLLFYAVATKNKSTSQEIKEIFQLLDDDADGFVELQKLIPLLTNMMELPESDIIASLVASRIPQPISKPAYPPHAHSLLEVHLDQAELSDNDWINDGKMSYEEFMIFIKN
jgi:Ca2+-binding EF-hand superfamily protein